MRNPGIYFSLACLPLFACVVNDGGDTDTSPTTQTSSGTSGPTTGEQADTSTTGSTSEATSDPSGTTEPVTTAPTSDATTSTSGGDTSSGGDDTSSGGDDTSSGGVVGLSWAADVYPVFVPAQCDCHTQSAGTLKMTNATDSYMNLVGTQANEAALSRVEPGNPDASYMWHKIHGTQLDVGGSGSMMPLGAGMLPESTLDLIEQWILEGANP